MADQGLGSENMDEKTKEAIHRAGGKASGGSNAGGSNTSGRGSKAGQRKGGKNSHDNQYTV